MFPLKSFTTPLHGHVAGISVATSESHSSSTSCREVTHGDVPWGCRGCPSFFKWKLREIHRKITICIYICVCTYIYIYYIYIYIYVRIYIGCSMFGNQKFGFQQGELMNYRWDSVRISYSRCFFIRMSVDKVYHINSRVQSNGCHLCSLDMARSCLNPSFCQAAISSTPFLE